MIEIDFGGYLGSFLLMLSTYFFAEVTLQYPDPCWIEEAHAARPRAVRVQMPEGEVVARCTVYSLY